MSHRTVALSALLVSFAVACSGAQNAADTDVRKRRKNCSLDKIRGGKECRCPAYTPKYGDAGADFQTDKTLRGDFFGDGEAVAMGLEGCGESPGIVLFDSDGKYRAFSTFDIDSCVVGPSEDGADLLGCMDDRPILARGTEATFVHVLSFAQAETTHSDRVIATYRRPADSCPTGKVKIIKDVELSGSDDFVATYKRAKVELSEGLNYCEWAKQNSPEFRSRTKALGTGADDPHWRNTSTTNRDAPSSGDETKQTEIDDYCSTDNIRLVLRSNTPAVERCLRDGLESRAIGFGTIKAILLIGLYGTVKDIGFDSDQLVDVGLRHCLTNVMRRFQFEQPNGGICLINAPFVLGPQPEE